MMAGLMDMARDLGGAMARTDEYQALQRAIQAADDDRELVELRNGMERLEVRVSEALRTGTEPDDEVKTEYEDTFTRLQANSAYQRLVSAQANFDKILVRVNETIGTGMQEAASSRIILPT